MNINVILQIAKLTF